MKGINPAWLTCVGLFLALQTNIATGNISLHYVLPDEWVPWAVGWAKAIAAYGIVIGAFLPQFSSSKTGYFVPLDVTSAVAPAAKLAAFLAVLCGLSLFMSDARAADVAKASPFANLATGYPYQTQGVYYGVYTLGGGGNVQGTAVGVNSNSLVTNEIGVGGTVGYAWGVPKSTVFVATEAMFGWKNFNAGNAGFSMTGPASFEQRIKIGTPLNTFLALLPNLGLPNAAPFPAMPNGQTVTNAQAYIMAGLHEDDNSLAYGLAANREWTLAPSVGLGVLGQLPNGVAVDGWVETVFPDKSICVGPYKCANAGQKVLAGLAFYF